MLCKKCGRAGRFYASIKSMCAECWKARARQRRRANADRLREFDRLRNRTPERRAHFAEKQRRKRQAEGPAYMRAHNLVQRAVASGRLVRPESCERCSDPCRVPHAHHDDHAKPLAVMWLCPVCHAARHAELSRRSA